MKIRDKYTITRWVKVLLFYLFTFLPLTAQDSLLLRDYHFVKQYDVWLSSPNAAALTRFAAPSIAEAELSLTKGNGGLTDYYESPNTLEVNAAVEAFYRLGRRTVVYGAIGYDNYTGRDMTGSAFIQPTRKPFDIVEDSLTNAGRKHRDTYHLTGAVGFDIWRGISVGARLDYTAANYAKYKDLRHKNKLMDLTVSAGIYAPLLPWLSAGSNYTYHRSTESLDFGTYGKSEKVYKSLIDYGAFMGLVEQFGNDGYTDKSREMPLFEDSHGGDFQIALYPSPHFSVFGSVGFSRGNGYYGRKSPFTITYTNHERHINETHLSLLYQPGKGTSRHRLDFRYANEKLAAYAETYRALTNETSAAYYEYYDAVETADKQWDDISICYTTQLGIKGETPTWQFCAGYYRTERKQAVYLFPFYRHQQLSTNMLTIGATRNILLSKGVLSCSLTAGYQKGSGTPYEDFTFTRPDSRQAPPATMDAFLYREYQYLTARQLLLGGNVKYSFRFPHTSLKTYTRLAADYRTATEAFAYSRGSSHTRLTIAVGCTF